MFTCVRIGSPFILVIVAVLRSVLQKQYMLQVQFPKLLYTQSAVSSCVVVREVRGEYSKTGDFILDLYWSGCRGDWPSANT